MKSKRLLIKIAAIILILSCNAQTGTRTADSRATGAASAATDTSGNLMNEEEFWKLIDQSRQAAGNNYQLQPGTLKSVLLKLDAFSIEAFNNRFVALMAFSYDSKLWGAAYVINGGCSDDCFEYFRHYLIGQGKTRFYNTLKDPDGCADWVKSEDEVTWEGLQYAAADAYKQKTGKDITASYNGKYELKGKLFDENTVAAQYPRLARKFLDE